MNIDNKNTLAVLAAYRKTQEEEKPLRVIEPRFLDGLAERIRAYAEGLDRGADGLERESWDSSGLRALEMEAEQLAAFLEAVAQAWRKEGSSAAIPLSPQH